jgi:hypothetical protein
MKSSVEMQKKNKKSCSQWFELSKQNFEEYELTICGHKDILQNAVLTDGKVRPVQLSLMDTL